MTYGRRGLLVLLVVGILLPGAILAVFGMYGLRQDRRLAERRTHDMLASLADLAAREVTRELARWQEWEDPSSATLRFSADGRVAAVRGVLWLPGEFSEPRLPPQVQRGEDAEIREANYPQALRLYEKALHGAGDSERGAILMRMARTKRKAGDRDGATTIWRRILTLPPSPATAVAHLALVEGGAAPAAEFYRDLLRGRIPLARESYFYYSTRADDLVTAAEIASFRKRERRAIALTEAVEAFLANRRRIPAAGFVGFSSAEKALVLPDEVLRHRLTKAAGAGLDATVRVRPRGAVSAIAAVRPLDDPQLPWQIEVEPRDPAALDRDLAKRQTWFAAAMAIVIAALVSGVWLTARTIRREWELSRLQSDFVATVSHEFRSPLTGIRQLAELLDSGVVPAEPQRREYYRLIVQETGRLSHLVENLLDFSRLEAGRKQYRMELIDPAGWLAEIIPAMRNARLATQIPLELPPVRGDRAALASALLNLIDNACKYSPSQSPVQLAACSDAGKLSISVTDSGPGIAPEEQKRIFERFYRVNGELSQRVKGAGIGLSLVKRIVEDHGGTVSVASQPGQGSTFTIDLNVATMEEAG